jgi:hypothetical protein
MTKTIAIITLLLASTAAAQTPRQRTAMAHLTDEATLTIDQIARSLSLMIMIRTICPRFSLVDADLAEKLGRVYDDTGRHFAGRRWPEIVRAEIKRRYSEIEAAGAEAWCERQRHRPELREVFG